MSDQLTPPPVLGPTMPIEWPPATERAPQPAPDTTRAAQPEVPAQPSPSPAPAPAPQEQPAATEDPKRPLTLEEKRARMAIRRVEALWKKVSRLDRNSKLSMLGLVIISSVITAFGSANAHDVLSHHHTPEPWGWFLYPALEAGLIMEIQIGGILADADQTVAFWGAALRFVTAASAITLCVSGPLEQGDPLGAFLHALGPVTQFFLAEFLAKGRRKFRRGLERTQEEAEAAAEVADRRSERRQEMVSRRSPKRSPRATRAGSETATKTATEEQDQDRSRDQETGPDLVLTSVEKKALAALQKAGKRVSKRTVIEEVRAAGGAIGTTRALQIAREWGPDSGGPALALVEQKEA